MILLPNTLILTHDTNGRPHTYRVLDYIGKDGAYVIVEIFMVSKKVKTRGDEKKMREYDDCTWPRLVRETVVDDYLKTGQVIASDPYRRKINLVRPLSPAEIAKRDYAWELIKPLLFDDEGNIDRRIFMREIRGNLILKRAQELNVTEKTLRKHLKRYWLYGQTQNALVGQYQKCGGRGQVRRDGAKRKLGRKNANMIITGEDYGINVTTEIEEIFRKELWKHLKGDTEIIDVYKLVCAEHFDCNVDTDDSQSALIPTYDTFYSYYKKFVSQDPEKWLRRQKGDRIFNQEIRDVSGSSTEMAKGPGKIYQIDPCDTGIHVVSSINTSEYLGRAIVTPVGDQFAHMIAGFNVGIRKDCMNALLALQNAFCDKVEYYQSLGIEITEEDFPAKGVCKAVITDRGAEFMSPKIENLGNLGVSLADVSAYRPELKGLAESLNRLIEREIRKRYKEGKLKKNHLPGDPDPKAKAYLTLKEIEMITALCILKINRRLMKHYKMELDMLEDGVPCRPVEIWMWGIKNRSGHLHIESKEKILVNLLLAGSASISREAGIVFDKRRYTCQLALDENWILKLNQKRGHIPISYHPDIPDVIYLHLKNGSVEPAYLVGSDKGFEGKTQDEINRERLVRNAMDAQRRGPDIAFDQRIDGLIDDVISHAKDRSQAGTHSNPRATIGNVTENKEREKQLNAEKKKNELIEGTGIVVVAEDQPNEHLENEEYIPRPTYRKEIQKGSGEKA